MKKRVIQKIIFRNGTKRKILASQILEFDDKQDITAIAAGLMLKEQEFLEKHIKIESEEFKK